MTSGIDEKTVEQLISSLTPSCRKELESGMESETPQLSPSCEREVKSFMDGSTSSGEQSPSTSGVENLDKIGGGKNEVPSAIQSLVGSLGFFLVVALVGTLYFRYRTNKRRRGLIPQKLAIRRKKK